VAQTAQQYPAYRNITQRLLEPLGAPEETHSQQATEFDSDARYGLSEKHSRAVELSFQGVSVKAAGHLILEDVDLEIKAGSHVAIVGPSGAGKSSLVGVLLGWHRPSNGRVFADGALLHGPALAQLRRETAWVDPTAQIWNRSLLDNLRYGAHGPADLPLSKAIELSQLSDALRKLPEGLQTQMGEAGGFVSGGEGQRVRLGRGMLRPSVRLVILDESFRGADRERRRELLSNSRLLWREATLLCITHDVSETKDFDRVIVLEHGRVVEDGPPQELLERRGSRYVALLEAEATVFEQLWGNLFWRRLRLENGRLINRDRAV
jgi:ATP-binding cassette subfamily B protein